MDFMYKAEQNENPYRTTTSAQDGNVFLLLF